MKTQALIELRKHAQTNLWPFPDRMRHLDYSELDFNTEIEIFHTKLLIVFEELNNNRIEYPDDDHKNYAGNVIEILQGTRDQVNQFFRADTPANNDYNKKLQQIEVEGVSEEPEPGLTPADSISETKLEFPVEALALYLNKICLWAEQVLNIQLGGGHNNLHLENISVAPAMRVQVLMFFHTDIFKYLVDAHDSNYTKISEIIASIIGEKSTTVKRLFPYFRDPERRDKNNPYRNDDVVKSLLEKLSNLEIDTSKLEEILSRIKK